MTPQISPILIVICNSINHFNHSRAHIKHCLFTGVDIVHCNVKLCSHIKKICTIHQSLAEINSQLRSSKAKRSFRAKKDPSNRPLTLHDLAYSHRNLKPA